jgi:hypothetical protein
VANGVALREIDDLAALIAALGVAATVD